MTEKLCEQNSLYETRLNGNFVLLLSPFWKLFGCCVRSVTEGYIERMMARHSATLGSGAQARAGVIPLQSTASTDAPFSSSKRVTATMPFRDDRCSGLKQKHPLSVYHSTHCTHYLAQNLPLTPSKLTAHIMKINADGCSMRSYYLKYRVIQKDGINWTVNGTSTHTRQLVAVFQVLCSLYGSTCVGYAQNSFEFISRSSLIHVDRRSFSLYTDSLFAQIGDSNDICSSSLEAECWNEDETHAAQQSTTQF